MAKTTKISKAPKPAKKVQRKCNVHEFSLKPVTDNMTHSINLNMSFCLSHGKKNAKTEQSRCLDYPCFNLDANIATPTFVLNSQKSYYSERKGKMLEEHEQKMVNYTDEKSSLNVPKPRPKSSYCSVCRISYDDYLDHIKSPNHHKKIEQAQFNPHILQLTNRFNKLKGRGDHQQDKRGMEGNTENQQGTSVDSDDVQIISNPYKIGNRYQRQMRPEHHPQFHPQFQPPFQPQFQPQMMPISQMNQFNYFQPFSSLYQNPINQVNQNYNMNMFMNPFFNYRPCQMSSFKPCLPLPYFSYPQVSPFNQNYPYSKPACIVIDE